MCQTIFHPHQEFCIHGEHFTRARKVQKYNELLHEEKGENSTVLAFMSRDLHIKGCIQQCFFIERGFVAQKEDFLPLLQRAARFGGRPATPPVERVVAAVKTGVCPHYKYNPHHQTSIDGGNIYIPRLTKLTNRSDIYIAQLKSTSQRYPTGASAGAGGRQ